MGRSFMVVAVVMGYATSLLRNQSQQRGHRQFAGIYPIDQNGAPNSIGDATAAGFRCATNVVK